MKNILFLHSSAELYGSDRSLFNLINNLDKTKYKIFVLLPCEGPLVELIKGINNVDVVIEKFAVLRRKNLNFIGIIKYAKDLIKSIWFINKLIKDNDINIVYTNTAVVFAGSISSKLMKKICIWHIREIISNKFERKVISKLVNSCSDIIIANSKATGNAITNDINKLRIVYNSIDISNINKRIVEKINGKVITVGMAGRINRWKGQKLFIEAAELVLREIPDSRFIIAGSAFKGEESLEKELEDYIDAKQLNDKIILLGQVDDMDYFYNQIDIFVLPSTQPEPFGLVILEAMARGIPVIATNHGGPIEIIENNENGYLVDYKNAHEMSEAIIKLINNEDIRNEIGLNGEMNQKTNFSINSYVSNIDTILEKL